MPAKASLLVIPALALSGCMVGNVDPHMHDPDSMMEPQSTTPVAQSIGGGAFQPIAPYTNIAGRALMVRRLDGKTELSIALTGLTASTMFTAHLHAAPCQYKGGGHYKIDPAVADVIETNELWLAAMSSDKGALVTDKSFTHVARGGALSIVVHDPAGGAKMACADLLEDDIASVELDGTLAPFAAATAADMTVNGTIKVTRTPTGTSFALDLKGLDPAAVGYGTHIHAEPCGVTTGGGHYKLDPLVVDALEANELWLAVTNYTTGATTSTLQSPHAMRSDGQSIVLHRTITDANKPKVACADLTRRPARLSLETTGSAATLPGGFGMTIGGSALMTRKLTGVTEVAVVITGLQAGATYGAHVHDQACSADSGGGHYKFDRSVAEARADNEIWFELTADDKGAAHDSTYVNKLAGASAASIVVHGADGARIACFDLN